MIPLPVSASVTRPIARPSIARRPFSFSLKIFVWSMEVVLSAMVGVVNKPYYSDLLSGSWAQWPARLCMRLCRGELHHLIKADDKVCWPMRCVRFFGWRGPPCSGFVPLLLFRSVRWVFEPQLKLFSAVLWSAQRSFISFRDGIFRFNSPFRIQPRENNLWSCNLLADTRSMFQYLLVLCF